MRVPGPFSRTRRALPSSTCTWRPGRKDSSITGCVRKGVKVWQIVEVVIFELLETEAIRKVEQQAGFVVLEP